MDFCPDISKVTVERTLTDLVKKDILQKSGQDQLPDMFVYDCLTSSKRG